MKCQLVLELTMIALGVFGFAVFGSRLIADLFYDPSIEKAVLAIAAFLAPAVLAVAIIRQQGGAKSATADLVRSALHQLRGGA